MRKYKFTYKIGDSKPALIEGASFHDVKQQVMKKNSGLRPGDIIVERYNNKNDYYNDFGTLYRSV